MKGEGVLGEWSDSLNAFWFGANNCEWVAWKGSHQIFEYPCDFYPNPPSRVIQHDKRIETLEDFTEAMYEGKVYDPSYRQVNACWQDEDK